jgi:hypothetical protein
VPGLEPKRTRHERHPHRTLPVRRMTTGSIGRMPDGSIHIVRIDPREEAKERLSAEVARSSAITEVTHKDFFFYSPLPQPRPVAAVGR